VDREAVPLAKTTSLINFAVERQCQVGGFRRHLSKTTRGTTSPSSQARVRGDSRASTARSRTPVHNTTTTLAVEMIEALAVDLLGMAYESKARSVEAVDSDVSDRIPDALPAVRVRVREAQLDTVRGHVSGEVSVIVYDDEWHRLNVERQHVATVSGSTRRGLGRLSSGDVRRVASSGTSKVSTLPDGTRRTEHLWTLSPAVPRVPVLNPGTVPERLIQSLAQSIALAVARPLHYAPRKGVQLGNGDASARVSTVAARVLAFSCVDGEPSDAATVAATKRKEIDSRTVARTVSVVLLAWPVNGACSWREAEARALEGIDSYHGRAVDGVGRVERVTVDSSTPLPTGIRIAARLHLAYTLPEDVSAALSASQAA
jgi:hypothetical protein